MRMRIVLNKFLLGAAALTPLVAAPAMAATHRFHADHVLGTSFDMAVVGSDAATASGAMLAARREIDRLELVLSGWRDDSELAALNRSTGAFRASPDLFNVISACESLRAACPGAFSGRLGSIESVWKSAVDKGVTPDGTDLTSLARAAEAANVRIELASHTINRNGVTFAIDAYAKGYIVDAALAAARRAAPNVAGVMVDIGGDVACSGSAPAGESAWRVGVANGGSAENAAPMTIVAIENSAIATSGTGARDRLVGATAHSHNLSPLTGAPSSTRLVTVTAPSAGQADAMATAFAALPANKAVAIANARPGIEARIVDAGGAVFTSVGWSSAIQPMRSSPVRYQVVAPRAGTARSAAWPAGFEVTINYEIPVVQAYRTKPPFVAIFITNEAGDLIRTITHLGNRPPRYLDSNYVWYRAFAAHGGDLAAVTRPSRAPGQYSAVWDGKDDVGSAVAQGRYIINVEISREHGGHSLQAIPLMLGAAPVSGAAAGQTESGPAAAHYGKAQ